MQGLVFVEVGYRQSIAIYRANSGRNRAGIRRYCDTVMIPRRSSPFPAPRPQKRAAFYDHLFVSSLMINPYYGEIAT